MGPTRSWTMCWAGLVALAAIPVAMAQEPTPPLPPPRPDRLPTSVSEPRAEKPLPNESVAARKVDPEKERAEEACLGRLKQLGLKFESRPLVQEKSCGIENPVLVSGLPNGVGVAPALLMGCPAAEGISRWMGEVVTPEAERQLQSVPTKLLIGTSYECRDQRNGEKLSEHAFGNGLDVMGLEFAKRAPVTIGKHGEDSPEATFEMAIRKGACPIFNTVLGPGSDADHGNHLHLDLRQRKGDYRICQ
jgi:hypothetical protein